MGLIEIFVAAAVTLGILGVSRERSLEEPEPPTPGPEPSTQPPTEPPTQPSPLQEGEIFLSLRDSDTSTPITGATVTLLDLSLPPPFNPQSFTETTTGSYLVSRILPGNYAIDMVAAGYESSRLGEVRLTEGESLSLTHFLIHTTIPTGTWHPDDMLSVTGCVGKIAEECQTSASINSVLNAWIIWQAKRPGTGQLVLTIFDPTLEPVVHTVGPLKLGATSSYLLAQNVKLNMPGTWTFEFQIWDKNALVIGGGGVSLGRGFVNVVVT